MYYDRDGSFMIDAQDQCFDCQHNGECPKEKQCPMMELLIAGQGYLTEPELVTKNCDFYKPPEGKLNLRVLK